MTLEERIEAARAAVGEQFGGRLDEAEDPFAVAYADAAVRAFAPELFTDPPTHWIAPLEATDAMCERVIPEWWIPGEPFPRSFWMMMRDVYLNREGK